MIIDSHDLTFNIPGEKIVSIWSRAEEMLRRRLNKVKVVASFVGLLPCVSQVGYRAYSWSLDEVSILCNQRC